MTSVAQRTRARKTRAEIKRANALRNRENGQKRRMANQAASSNAAKNSALSRLAGALTRQQYEAGCRLRDDWLEHQDVKAGAAPDADRGTGGGVPHERLMRQVAALGQYRRALVAMSLPGRNCVIAVCVSDRMPAELSAKSEGRVAEATIMKGLREGLAELVRHYERCGA